MTTSIREMFGISLIGLLISLFLLLREFRKRRLDPNCKMNFKIPKYLVIGSFFFLFSPIIIIMPLEMFRNFLADHLSVAYHLFAAGLFTFGLFALLYSVSWRYKWFIEPNKPKPPIDYLRTRSLFFSSMFSYLFFCVIAFERGSIYLALGMSILFFVFFTYELRYKQRMKMQKSSTHCEE